MILVGTGHREIKYPNAVKSQVRRTFEEAEPDMYVQGMADGFDLLSAVVAIQMKIPVFSAMPWTHHFRSTKDANTYRFVLDNSEEVYVVAEAETFPGAWCFHARNEWMIDYGDRVMAWWDKRESGGTYAAIKYANKTDKLVRNIYVPF